MLDPVVTVTEEVNGVTLQLPEDSHVGFPTAMSADASDQEFYLRKSVVRPSARPPIVRPHLSPGQRLDGIVVGTRSADDSQIRSFIGGHPLPNEHSWEAAGAVLEYLSADGQEQDETLVLFLISGGASAMLERPLDSSMTLADTIGFHQALVHSGLNIETMNVLRKHLSAVKGGRLAVAAGSATQCTLLISDVPGTAIHIVGSGPTLPDPSTLEDCIEILDSHRKVLPFSDKVMALYRDRILPETPKSGNVAFARSSGFALLSSEDLCVQAAALAREQGFFVEADHTCDEWDYEEAADYLLQRVQLLGNEHPRVCLISVGEVSVQLKDSHGVGGRNQQFVVQCARRMTESGQRVTVLSGGSDGIDGNSSAAGGVADESTVSRAAALGMTATEALGAFDTHKMLRALGDTLLTGPSGNNVRDLRLLLVDRTAKITGHRAGSQEENYQFRKARVG